MNKDNMDVWDFDSFFASSSEDVSLTETPPSERMTSTAANNRQILPIFFIIDVSGSMKGQRIAQVNYALENIFKELRKKDDFNAVIKIAIMKFSDRAEWITKQPILLKDYIFAPIEATPYGTFYSKAFDCLNADLRRDRFLDPSLGDYFAPLILFITDGEPLDENMYPAALNKLNHNGWFVNAAKYAIAAGKESKNNKVKNILMQFTKDIRNVRYADEGEALCQLIEFIAIRGSEIHSSMVSASANGMNESESVFNESDSSWSEMFR